ncbi:MAG TPA: hypothetical protein VFR97_01650 [Capillimicrobium sp.]|nr:hypothetical protein [Capillimicrobium sp.]
MSPELLAHVGHWTTSLLYLAPVAVVVVWLAIQSFRQKRRDRTDR